MIVDRRKKNSQWYLVVKYRYRNSQSARLGCWPVLALLLAGAAVVLDPSDSIFGIGKIVALFCLFLFYVSIVERVNRISIYVVENRFVVRNRPLPRPNFSESAYDLNSIEKVFYKRERNRHRSIIPYVMVKLKNGTIKHWLLTSTEEDAREIILEVNHALGLFQQGKLN